MTLTDNKADDLREQIHAAAYHEEGLPELPEVIEVKTVLALIDADRKKLAEERRRLADELDEMRKHLERESHWCEDCEIELEDSDDQKQHSRYGHEVVRITIFGGWQIHVLNKAVAELSQNPSAAQRSSESG